MKQDEIQRTGDPYLDSYATKYQKWLREGMVKNTSKVIPVRTSLEALQWILPREQTITYLREAKKIALTDCACRVHYQRCDRPVETCLLFDDAAEQAVKMNGGKWISAERAEEVIQIADEAGLVHMTLYAPKDRPYAICNCCPCCCHDLQLLIRYGNLELTARSDYVASTDTDTCTSCGRCVERCVFGARQMKDGRLSYESAACYGCGLCVSVCPTSATRMVPRSED